MSEAVPVSQVEVAAQCLDGGRSDGDDPACAALAAADMDQIVGQVEVPDLECDDFADSDAGFEHEPDDRLVAAMVEGLVRSGAVRGRAGTDESSELVVCERIDHGLPSHPELSHPGGPAARPASSAPATNQLREIRFMGSPPRLAHQEKYRRRPSP